MLLILVLGCANTPQEAPIDKQASEENLDDSLNNPDQPDPNQNDPIVQPSTEPTTEPATEPAADSSENVITTDSTAIDSSAFIDTQGTAPTQPPCDPALDNDNDGLTNGEEGCTAAGTEVDTDGDGNPDYNDADSDNDGILDITEGKNAAGEIIDTDGDGTPDFQDEDSDNDTIPDDDETVLDIDGDGIPEWRDPINDGPTQAVTLVAITTSFNSPVGIDYHEASTTVMVSVNYPSGNPHVFERIFQDGSSAQFSSYGGLTNEVKIATARQGSSFTPGTLFVGNGTDGQITRVSSDGLTIDNPWVDLPGSGNGLMRGSLYVDRTGLYNGDLIIATTNGQVWQVDGQGTATQIGNVPGVHFEGLLTVPDAPARYGPLAGKIIIGAEQQGLLYAFDGTGAYSTYNVGVNIEDIDIIMPNENFFGVNYGSQQIIGVAHNDFREMQGDILLTQEGHSNIGLFRLRWNGSTLYTDELPVNPGAPSLSSWEHVTFAGAGIAEISGIDSDALPSSAAGEN